MITNDAMEPSTSPWFSRFVLVAKKDGSVKILRTQCKELEESTRVLRHVFGTGELVTDPEKINVLRD